MSTTTQEQTPDTSPAQNKIALEKKKLKILKNALKQERLERSNIEQELAAAFKSIENLKNQVNEKVRSFADDYVRKTNTCSSIRRISIFRKPQSESLKDKITPLNQSRTLSSLVWCPKILRRKVSKIPRYRTPRLMISSQ